MLQTFVKIPFLNQNKMYITRRYIFIICIVINPSSRFPIKKTKLIFNTSQPKRDSSINKRL